MQTHLNNKILILVVIQHNQRMLNSFRTWTGRELISRTGSTEQDTRILFESDFAVVSHGTESDPIFKYGNKKALELFEMSWEEFTQTPSRNSAEPVEQEQRARFMEQVTRDGFVDNYEGIRVSKTGRRFLVKNAIVWNVLDYDGKYCGQAATFSEWSYLQTVCKL